MNSLFIFINGLLVFINGLLVFMNAAYITISVLNNENLQLVCDVIGNFASVNR